MSISNRRNTPAMSDFFSCDCAVRLDIVIPRSLTSKVEEGFLNIRMGVEK